MIPLSYVCCRPFLMSAMTTALVACGSEDHHPDTEPKRLPQLSAASGSRLSSCDDLLGRFSYPDTTVTASKPVPAGALNVAGRPIPAHCQVTGNMFQRVSPVDGQHYAIGFEMRLPDNWNGRFFYQANGGIDGSVSPALGPVGGDGPLDNALNQGFAVLSSDAGHSGAQNPGFGIDPQARLDYGYQTVGKLTPMAKSLIRIAYGKSPDRSYIGGCSNGGRHTMVAAARYAEHYDGYLVGNPGYRLPFASAANMAGARAYAALASTPGDLSTGFTLAERALVSTAILEKCDFQDGARDGLIQNPGVCQRFFKLDRDVPTCKGARDGSCLSSTQKSVIGQLFAGATTESGRKIYAAFPYDAGLATNGWAAWKFENSARLDPTSAIIFKTPPSSLAGFDGKAFALSYNLDSLLAEMNANDTRYTESAMSFMLPPNATDLDLVRNRGAKMLVYHGVSDPIFSSEDTRNWYEGVRTAHAGDASDFVRYFQVPGMNHCGSGPSTDQFDMLSPLVNWVEKGLAPDSVQATARGVGNPAGANADVPPDWSSNRTRPLCPYPNVAIYSGTGSVEEAANFTCRSPG